MGVAHDELVKDKYEQVEWSQSDPAKSKADFNMLHEQMTWWNEYIQGTTRCMNWYWNVFVFCLIFYEL